MNVAVLMDELAEPLAAIGLCAYPFSAESIEPPAAVIAWPEPIKYDATMGRGMDSMMFPVWIVVGRADALSARDTLAAYLDGSGASSAKVALEGWTYAACDSVRVAQAHVEAVSIAGIDYLAAILDVEVSGRGGV